MIAKNTVIKTNNSETRKPQDSFFDNTSKNGNNAIHKKFENNAISNNRNILNNTQHKSPIFYK